MLLYQARPKDRHQHRDTNIGKKNLLSWESNCCVKGREKIKQELKREKKTKKEKELI